MILVSVRPEGDDSGENGLLRFEFSGGSSFQVKTCYLFSLEFAFGVQERELSPGEEEALRFAAGCLKAERRALRLIARAEQSLAGLRRKLERYHPAACVRAVLGRLSDMDAVNDLRFAEFWLVSGINRRSASPRRLLGALRNRGIAEDDAVRALKKVLSPALESELLVRYIQKNELISEKGREVPGFRSRLRFEGFSSASIQSFRESRE